MAGRFEQAATYVPRYSVEGRAVPSPDEDPFTMAVAGLEALRPIPDEPRLSKVHLVGEFPPIVEWALPAYLGGPVELVRHDGDAAGLGTAVRDAQGPSTDERAAAVVVFDRTGPEGAETVVLRFGTNAAARPLPWDDHPGTGSVTSLARSTLTAGGWKPSAPGERATRPPPWPVEPTLAFVSTTTARVSEGAYVPRARYLENLPSRWRLEADRCARCDRVTFPRRGRCRYCQLSDRLSVVVLPRDGARVVAATMIGKGGQPTEFDPQVEALGEYGVVLAEFEPGVRFTLPVTDAAPGEIGIGERIGTRLRRLYPMEGEWRYGRKAVPLGP